MDFPSSFNPRYYPPQTDITEAEVAALAAALADERLAPDPQADYGEYRALADWPL